jgi:hypothetical protein
MEVPTACNPIQGLGSCGQDPCGRCNNGCQCNGAPAMNGGMPVQEIPTPVSQMPGGTGYDDPTSGATILPSPDSDPAAKTAPPVETAPASASPQELALPESAQKPAEETKPAAQPPLPPPAASPASPATPEATPPKPGLTPPVGPVPGPTPNSGSYYPSSQPAHAYTPPTNGSAQAPAYSAPHTYSPQRQPVFMRNASKPYNPQAQQSQQAAQARENVLIGPVGYDVQQ